MGLFGGCPNNYITAATGDYDLTPINCTSLAPKRFFLIVLVVWVNMKIRAEIANTYSKKNSVWLEVNEYHLLLVNPLN